MENQAIIIVFGAGSGGIKATESLESMGYYVTAFLDNDSKKWGTKIIEKEILEPKTILDKYPDCIVVIASIYHESINIQLQQLGIKKDRIKIAEELIYEYLNNHLEKWKQTFQPKRNQEKIVFVEAVQGLGLGGIEQWTRIVVDELLNRKQPVKILTRREELENNDRLSKHMIGYDFNEANYLYSLKELVKEISSHLPCTLLLNRINQVYMAAHIIKYFFPKEIKIIYIMHSDFERFYHQCKIVESDIDNFICVSSKIQTRMIKEYHIKSSIYYIKSPVNIERGWEKKIDINQKFLRIGYAARIEKGQKRSDLLIPLVQELEKRKLNYILEIAGNGTYFQTLKEQLKQIANTSTRLLGTLSEKEMKQFWKRQDIYINVSTIEGCAISLLEAMSYGVVPVMTKVSGADDFVIHGINGYLIEQENMKQMADYLNYLSKNRKIIENMSNICKNKIFKECKAEEYVTTLKKLF